MKNFRKNLNVLVIVISSSLSSAAGAIYLYINYFESPSLSMQIYDDFNFEVERDRLPVVRINASISNYGNKIAPLKDKASLNLISQSHTFSLIITLKRRGAKFEQGTSIPPKENNVPFVFELDFNNFYLDRNLVTASLSSIWFPTDSTDILRTIKAALNYLDRLKRQNINFNINIVAETENGREVRSNNLIVSAERISQILSEEFSNL